MTQCNQCIEIGGELGNADGLKVSFYAQICDPTGEGEQVADDIIQLINSYMNELDGVTEEDFDTIDIETPEGVVSIAITEV
jgi:hypothetical protein